MGEFFDPTPGPGHDCDLPEYAWHLGGWRCECGKAYVKVHYEARDTNPGERSWDWQRAPEHDRPERPKPTLERA